MTPLSKLRLGTNFTVPGDMSKTVFTKVDRRCQVECSYANRLIVRNTDIIWWVYSNGNGHFLYCNQDLSVLVE